VNAPSRNDATTTACPVCGRAVHPVGRRRFCSDACRQAAWRRRHPPAPPGSTRSPRPATIYECAECGARYLGQQRCQDCHRFARRVGPGGLCPHCDEPVAVADLIAEHGR
jgi:hypothetical protein